MSFITVVSFRLPLLTQYIAVADV